MILAVLLLANMGAFAFAEDEGCSITINSTPNEQAAQIGTLYTWYRIFEASIENANQITVDPETGVSTAATGENAPRAAYYVTTAERAAATEQTGLFNVMRVGTED